MTSKSLFARMNSPVMLRIVTIGGIRGGVTAANVALFAFLSAGFGLDAVGNYATYIGIVTIAGYLITFGLPNMLMRRIALGRDKSILQMQRVRSIYWLASLPLYALATLVMVAITPWLNHLLKINLPPVSALGPVAFAATMLVVEELKGRSKLEPSVLCEHMGTILLPTGTVLGAMALHQTRVDIVTILIGVHIATALAMVLGFLAFNRLRIGRHEWRGIRTLLTREQMRDLGNMAVLRTLSGVTGSSAVVLASALCDAQTAGIVAVIVKLTGLAATYTGILVTNFAARLGAAVRKPQELAALSRQSTLLTLAGVSLLMAPMAILPGLFLKVFSVPTATGAIELALVVTALSRIVRAGCGISEATLLILGQSHLENISIILSQLLLLVMMLASHDTVLEIGIAMAASSVAKGVLSWIFLRQTVHRAAA